ncbi:hypothetical protein EVAR_67176_1 [Eumeta japonica]|uniref:Uncharacterized protein n=1 Tax=Eumeta variegata TaxID=151549 RepID=A0A4C1ZWF6_EUMVA|nr:hypothetical protein EVAR_67176_1 [Eumeta japonica]
MFETARRKQRRRFKLKISTPIRSERRAVVARPPLLRTPSRADDIKISPAGGNASLMTITRFRQLAMRRPLGLKRARLRSWEYPVFASSHTSRSLSDADLQGASRRRTDTGKGYPIASRARIGDIKRRSKQILPLFDLMPTHVSNWIWSGLSTPLGGRTPAWMLITGAKVQIPDLSKI